MKRIVALLGLALALTPGVAHAEEFWVDPAHGRSSNDGSASAPWRSLQEVLDAGLIESQRWESLPYKKDAKLIRSNAGAPVKPGDTIYLRSGYYGDLRVRGFYNAKDISVVAQDGHEPRFRSVRVRSGSHWVFRGLHVSPEYAPEYEETRLFDLDSHGWHGPIHDIVVEDCRLQSIEDSARWTASDWDALACDGLEVDGANMIIRNNVLRNVNHGISAAAENSLVQGNLVENFAGDGMRGFGDYSTFEYNTIKNCYNVNGNHDDGFQSWASGSGGVGTGEVVGIVLRGNIFINYEDPNQPHRGTMQGIGCFDGMYVDWVIENNVIIADHWHGISLYGARNSRVVNNTVLDPNDQRPGPPWIRISGNKNGNPSTGSLIRNNLATAISIGEKQKVTVDHNLIIKNANDLFVDAAGYDLHLKKRSEAVNAGSPNMAPNTDIERVPRPWGNGYDIGAYEYHESEIAPDSGDKADTKVKDTREDHDEAGNDSGKDQTDEAPIAEPPSTVKEPSAAADTVTEESSKSIRRGVQGRFGSVSSWAVVLLAMSLVFMAWRIGRYSRGS